MERKNYLCRFFLNLTLADYNNLWQGLVNKTKYKMDKNIYEKKNYIASLILGVLNA